MGLNVRKGFFSFLKRKIVSSDKKIKFVHFTPSSFSNIFWIPFRHIAFLFFFVYAHTNMLLINLHGNQVWKKKENEKQQAKKNKHSGKSKPDKRDSVSALISISIVNIRPASCVQQNTAGDTSKLVCLVSQWQGLLPVLPYQILLNSRSITPPGSSPGQCGRLSHLGTEPTPLNLQVTPKIPPSG